VDGDVHARAANRLVENLNYSLEPCHLRAPGYYEEQPEDPTSSESPRIA
jgi:hypothetical protein